MIAFDNIRETFSCHCGCGLADPHPVLVMGLYRVQAVMGIPLFVTSGSRCVDHNCRPPTETNSRGVYGAGGSPGSWHQPKAEFEGYTCAADVVAAGRTLWQFAAAAEEDEAFLSGGIGVYVDKAPRLHLDIRGIISGHGARWGQIDGRDAEFTFALVEDEKRRRTA